MTQERKDQFYDELEQLESDQIVRAFTDWHGTQLLTDQFLEFCIEEGYIYSEDDEDME